MATLADKMVTAGLVTQEEVDAATREDREAADFIARMEGLRLGRRLSRTYLADMPRRYIPAYHALLRELRLEVVAVKPDVIVFARKRGR